MIKKNKNTEFILDNFFIKVEKEIKDTKNIKDLELLRIKYLCKKVILRKKEIIKSHEFKIQKNLYKKLYNYLSLIKKFILQRKSELKKIEFNQQIISENIDFSLPGRKVDLGGLHPISTAILKIEEFFKNIGFIVIPSIEIEDKYHNFHALNIKENHPAYNEKDTFWFNSNTLLRSQTSSAQVHIMNKIPLPIRVITFGKVYRRDYDSMHTPMFHQVEGLIVDKNISFLDLKSILFSFLKNFFYKRNIRIRFRPSYFPFTEPSGEIDIAIKEKKNINFWVEVLGCGMIHPKILDRTKINKKIYSGLAFGIGIERLVMLLHDINDLRYLFRNDLSFLKQFN